MIRCPHSPDRKRTVEQVSLARLAHALLISIAVNSPVAAAELKPAMRKVVNCVYDMVRSHAGILSTDVYSIGKAEYIVEYKFRGDRGAMFTGGMGIWTDAGPDGNFMYTNETPSGQPDNNGSVELDYLGDEFFTHLYAKCHLMPSFDDTIRLAGTPPDPPREKVDMPALPK